jgi:hypothetical protein
MRYPVLIIFFFLIHTSDFLQAQALKRWMFCGTLADISVTWSFEPDSNYHCIGGSSYRKGKYTMWGDTILLTSSYNVDKKEYEKNLDNKFIIDSAGCLVSIRSTFAFRPIKSLESYVCGPIGIRNIKYPQIDTKDSTLKSLIWKMLQEIFINEKFVDVLPNSTDTITITDYFFLNRMTQPDFYSNGRYLIFQPNKGQIHIDDVQVNSDMVVFMFTIEAEKINGVYVRFINTIGSWRLEWIKAWNKP